MMDFTMPLSVPETKKSEFKKNYSLATFNTGRMLLFAGDQKIEHLNDDFYGPKISKEDSNPDHLFKIANESKGALLATHLGLVSRYGKEYPKIPYLIKINGKTNIGNNDEKDSSSLWWDMEDVLSFKKQSGLKIVGVGYTVYLGGRYESKMLAEAAKMVYQAHQNGLIAVLWMYPRGKGVKEEDIHTIAGGAGVAACLDADFVKVKYPYGGKNDQEIIKKFTEVIDAAGRTKVICVGGNYRQVKEMLHTTKNQINIVKTSGLAIGRNLHQRSLPEAVKLADNLSKIIHSNQKNKAPRFLGLF